MGGGKVQRCPRSTTPTNGRFMSEEPGVKGHSIVRHLGNVYQILTVISSERRRKHTHVDLSLKKKKKKHTLIADVISIRWEPAKTSTLNIAAVGILGKGWDIRRITCIDLDAIFLYSIKNLIYVLNLIYNRGNTTIHALHVNACIGLVFRWSRTLWKALSPWQCVCDTLRNWSPPMGCLLVITLTTNHQHHHRRGTQPHTHLTHSHATCVCPHPCHNT